MDVRTFPLSEFKVKQANAIGAGSFGEVWDAWHEKYNRVAVKILRLRETPERFINEVSGMLKASGEFSAVPMFGCIASRGSEVLSLYGIVSQFMPCGTLYDFLHKHQIKPAPCLAYRMLHEISKAMMRLHNASPDQRLLHCDLKPDNILLDGDLHAKISDFGAARLATLSVYRSVERRENNAVYTLNYAAPEFLRYGVQRDSKFDIYSFAIVMWEVLTQKKPYLGHNHETISSFVTQSDGRPNINEISVDVFGAANAEDLRQMIRNCWHSVPEQRPDFAVIENFLHRLAKVPETENDAAVSEAKRKLLEKLGKDSFEILPDDYNIALEDVLRRGFAAGGAQPIQDERGDRISPAAPQGDILVSSVIRAMQPRLTDQDCLKLGTNFHYSDGWEVFAYRIGLSQNIVENIKEDCDKAIERKVAVFKEWKSANGQENAKVKDLIRVLRAQKVAVGVWEFLDQDREIRQELDS